MTLALFIPKLFDDDVFHVLNYNGIGRHGEKKIAMKNYMIFTDCMLGEYIICVF